MNQFVSEANLIVQGCALVVMIGVFYNLMVTTKAYGGVIGTAIRLIGIGITFFSLNAIERVLANFAIINNSFYLNLSLDIMNLVGLIFLGLGFSKLASATKS